MKRILIAFLCILLLVPSFAFCETGSLTEEAVSIGDPALPGTLTLPEGAASPLPAVVLLHGSGPNDRDESIGQTKMFRDLAEMLAEKGIAVLRYDKRTLIYGSRYTAEDLKTFTVDDESIQDAVAAANLLRSDPRIGKVFLEIGRAHV